MITTKRHPLKFYLTVVLGFLFFAAMGSFTIYMYFDLSKNGEAEPKTLLMLLFGIIVLFLAFYTVKQYLKNSPKITVDKYNISFGTEKYSLAAIKEITLTGKMPFKYLIEFPMEGAFLVFKDDTEKYIFNDMYSNTWKIKSFLEKTVIEKQEYKATEDIKISPNAVRFQKADDFKGLQWTSMRGISLWGMLGVFLFIILHKGETSSIGFWIFLLGFGSFWFFLYSRFMHYFSLTSEFLIVKNHNLIWRQHIYKLSNIKEVTFETQGKMPNCLRIITKDYRNNLYPAGTLREKTWLEFKKRLEKNGIPVRNECIY